MADMERIRELAAIVAAGKAADLEMRDLIWEATQGDTPRDRVRLLAEASGLSVPRIYQIRDGRR